MTEPEVLTDLEITNLHSFMQRFGIRSINREIKEGVITHIITTEDNIIKSEITLEVMPAKRKEEDQDVA